MRQVEYNVARPDGRFLMFQYYQDGLLIDLRDGEFWELKGDFVHRCMMGGAITRSCGEDNIEVDAAHMGIPAAYLLSNFGLEVTVSFAFQRFGMLVF